MLEIEMKFPVQAFDGVQAKLEAWQAAAQDAVIEEDHYFNAPDRDFAQTDEAFRLRRVGQRNKLTYKGPKQPGPAKTRTEIEVPLADGDEPAERFCQLVAQLQYRATAVVRKQRRESHFQRDGFDITVTLDEVKELGRYVEVEIVAAPAQRDKALATLQQIAAELGLNRDEKRSYLEMVLAQRS